MKFITVHQIFMNQPTMVNTDLIAMVEGTSYAPAILVFGTRFKVHLRETVMEVLKLIEAVQ
jgi:hypothetical protein